MNELISVIKSYSLADVVIIGFGIYAAWYFIRGRIKEARKEKKEELKNYHVEQSQIEHHDESIEERLNKHEEWIGNDKEQIRGLGSHLEEIEAKNDLQSAVLSELSNSVRDLRIQSIREQILAFYNIAVNLQKHPSKESYEECIRQYEIYERLMKEKNETNGFLDYTYGKIMESMEQREKFNLFAENFFVPGKPMKEQIPSEPEIVEGFHV